MSDTYNKNDYNQIRKTLCARFEGSGFVGGLDPPLLKQFSYGCVTRYIFLKFQIFVYWSKTVLVGTHALILGRSYQCLCSA